MIEICELSKSYDKLTVLNNISLSIEDGKIYGLIGKSGSGKSTLLRCINGLIPYDSGHIIVDNIEVSGLARKELRSLRSNIGMIFQNFSLLNRSTVYQNIALPMRCWKYNNKEIDQRISELLELVHLSDKKDAYPDELSGGQKQRVAIARALALNPKILLCDEATSALDPNIAETIMELLTEINKNLGITIVIVTHQLSIVRRFCEKAFVLEDGKIVADEKCRDLFLNPPKALCCIMGKAESADYLSKGINVRIIMDAESVSEDILTKMAIETGISFSILKVEKEQFYHERVVDTLINITEDAFPGISNWLDNNNLLWSVEEA